MLEGEGSGAVGQALKGDGREDGTGGGGVVLTGAVHLLFEGGGLHSTPDADETPLSDGHLRDQRCFRGIVRLKLEGEGGGEVVEVVTQGFAA